MTRQRDWQLRVLAEVPVPGFPDNANDRAKRAQQAQNDALLIQPILLTLSKTNPA
jgi:hypothetical protein